MHSDFILKNIQIDVFGVKGGLLNRTVPFCFSLEMMNYGANCKTKVFILTNTSSG